MIKKVKGFKRLTLLIGVITLMLCGLGLIACERNVDNGTSIDYGTLVIEDISLVEGKKAKIDAIFTKEAYKITYSFDGNLIKIEDGYVTALNVGVTNVTATTEHHSVTFKVTVSEPDYGELLVSVPSLFPGQSAKLIVRFTNGEYAEEVTDENYTFDGDAISIENGYVTALKGGEKVTVSVTTKNFTSSFVVKTLVDQGLKIEDVYTWVGYPATQFFPVFEDENCEEKITYTYDKSKITIDEENQTVTALAAGDVAVVAESENTSTTFIVKSEILDTTTVQFKDPTGLKAYAPSRTLAWDNDGIDGKTTIFIGDSFFSPEYWANFYELFAGKDALCLGIGGSTAYMWELWLDEYFANINPKNIVMNMGTNNLVNTEYSESPEATALSLQRLFSLMHKKYPNANIYYFSIAVRGDENATKSDAMAKISAVNEKMKEWCEKIEYVTYVSVEDTVTLDMLGKDKIHPKLETYAVYKAALEQTDIVIEDLSFEDLSMTFGSLSTFNFNGNTHERKLYYHGETLKDNYIISGKLDITGIRPSWGVPTTFFGVQVGDNRIMLSYNGMSGTFDLKMEGDSGSIPQEDTYAFATDAPLTLNWKIVMANGDMYFYINDELKLICCNLPAGELMFGTDVAECRFYDFDIVSKKHDEERYAQKIAEYEDTIFEYVNEIGNVRV